jgi:FkbM family methyltransferase
MKNGYVDDRTVDAATLVRLSEYVKLVKVDAEGNELNVLRSLAPLIVDRRVGNLVVELTPIFWARAGVLVNDMIDVLCTIVASGYNGVTLARKKPVMTTLETCDDVSTLLRARPSFSQVDVWFQFDGVVDNMCEVLGEHCHSTHTLPVESFSNFEHAAMDKWFEKITRALPKTMLVKALEQRPSEADVIIDVGLNVGAFASLALELCTTCSVIGFEALPKYAAYAGERLVRRFTSGGPFRVVDRGLSNTSEHLSIYASTSANLGWNTLVAEKATADMVPIPVTLISFDAYVQAARLNVSRLRVVKIDTEGFEYKVLAGMRSTLASVCPRVPIVMEIGWGARHPHIVEERIELEYLASIGYERLGALPNGTQDVLLIANRSHPCSV